MAVKKRIKRETEKPAPNSETLEAIKECERLAVDPNTKTYTAQELIAELRAQCTN